MSLFNSLMLAKNVRESIKPHKTTQPIKETSQGAIRMPKLNFDYVKILKPAFSRATFYPLEFLRSKVEESFGN
ncbi:hypothetical protein SteCoe_16704 [Stentor coeruleus]|uniref:Uncharacterized protein n=1 Tax=Stentor coeruleus TaxID=5963 RepID=A0A1R2C0I9_9CILI|nr:hypothetical protein SteCoe_16704 [Stentor coeruleus]